MRRIMSLLWIAVLFAALSLSSPVVFANAADSGKSSRSETSQAGADAGEQAVADDAEEEKPGEFTDNSFVAVIGGKETPYVVKTGFTPIYEDDEAVAQIFSTSYIMKDGARERPVFFLFNGGPGAASAYLHMGSFSPVIGPETPQGLTPPEPPFKVRDNPDSLLDVADLVFVDPVGTGFSFVKKRKSTGRKKIKSTRRRCGTSSTTWSRWSNSSGSGSTTTTAGVRR